MYKGKIFTSKEQLEKDYKEFKSSNKIAEKYNVNQKTVLNLMKHFDIKTIGSQGARKHNFNHDYFENIDTEEKAYWLGFIMADGCVYKGSDKYSLRLQINLKGDDKEHLEKFQKAIGSNYKIQLKDCKGSSVAILKINSTKMCNDLINLGVIQRKSIVCEYPNINEKYNKHFIRGYFDGDGCITSTDRNTRLSWKFSIVGGEGMLNSIKDKLPEDISIYDRKNQNVVYLETGSHERINNVMDWLYENSKTYLDRKYSKYKEFKSYYSCPL